MAEPMNCCCSCLCADPIQSLVDWFDRLDIHSQQALAVVGMFIAYAFIASIWEEWRGKR